MTTFQRFFIGLLAAIGFVVVLLFILVGIGYHHPAFTAFNDPTETEIQQASGRYIAENGSTPKDLTAEQEEYLKAYTAQLQVVQNGKKEI